MEVGEVAAGVVAQEEVVPNMEEVVGNMVEAVAPGVVVMEENGTVLVGGE